MKNKKALSVVVSVVIIIGLTVIAGGIIWSAVGNLAKKDLDKTKACFNLFEKISINDDYTCYNSSGNKMQISISRGEISLNSLLISISSETESKSYRLYEEEVISPNVTSYPSDEQGVTLPGNSSGKTYFLKNLDLVPIKIQIAPEVSGYQCEVSDEITTIVNCV